MSGRGQRTGNDLGNFVTNDIASDAEAASGGSRLGTEQSQTQLPSENCLSSPGELPSRGDFEPVQT
jgi:hypothetical protein